MPLLPERKAASGWKFRGVSRYAFPVADTLTIAERSRLMSKIRGKNTGPERAVRSLLHRAGFRFRLHVRGLPGTPDVVLPKYRAVVFVHGCFWHRHPGCRTAQMPKSHRKFWADKFARNVANDCRHRRRLRRLGWRVAIVWECQLKRPERVRERLERFLRPGPLAYAPLPAAKPPLAAENRPAWNPPG